MGQQLALPTAATEAGISKEMWNALTNAVFPGAKEDSVVLAYQYCKARNLDVMKKVVHIVPMSVKDMTTNRYVYRDVIMPGIAELRTTAARTGMTAGKDKPIFGEMVEIPVTNAEVKDVRTIIVPDSCEVTVYRLDRAGVPRAYTHIEYFEEAVARTKDGRINDMWQRRSRGQLAKVAEAGALRAAFPEELGGTYAAEEMEGKNIGPDPIPGEVAGEFSEVSGAGDDFGMPGEIEDGEVVNNQRQPEQGREPGNADDTQLIDREEAEMLRRESMRESEREAVNTGAGKNSSEPQRQQAKPTTNDTGFSITLEDGPRRVLNKRMETHNLDEAALLKGFGKNIDIGNINEVFTWIKDNCQ